jgi:hypothetical protein
MDGYANIILISINILSFRRRVGTEATGGAEGPKPLYRPESPF